MLLQTKPPSPDNYLETLNYRNTCMHLHKKAEERLCSLFGVNRHGIDQELLIRRAHGVSHQERQAIAEWQQAENDLDHACSLLEVAIRLRQDEIHRNLDE